MAVSIKTVQRSPRSQGCSPRSASGPKSPMGMPMCAACSSTKEPVPAAQILFIWKSATSPPCGEIYVESCPPISKTVSASGTQTLAALACAVISSPDDARVAGNAAGEDNGLMDGETAHDRRLIVADHRVAQAEQDVLLGDALLLAVDGVGLGEHGAASVSARPDARRASCGAARRPRRPACRPEKEVKKPWFLAHLW